MHEKQFRFLTWSAARYVGRDVLVGFIGGTTIFIFIMLMFQVIRLSDFVVVHNVGIKDVGRLSAYLMLSFIPIAIPVAFLFSVLMGVSRANSEGEILALQVNGISLFQVFAPLAIFSVFISLVCLYCALYLVPQGNRLFELLITKLGQERVMSTLKPGVFQEGFYGLVLYSEQLVPSRNEMKRVFIYDEREGDHPLAITAKAGLLKNLKPGDDALTLRLSDGTIHVDRKMTSQLLQKIDFDLYDINLDVSEKGDGWRAYSPPSYNYQQLKAQLIETAHDPLTHRQLLVELHRRFSLSFSCVVFAALGFAISIFSQRGIRSTAILVCLLVGVVYWLSYLVANALAAGGWIVPWLGIWLPNFLFLLLAYFFYRRYRWA